jgi:hypothetical protein
VAAAGAILLLLVAATAGFLLTRQRDTSTSGQGAASGGHHPPASPAPEKQGWGGPSQLAATLTQKGFSCQASATTDVPSTTCYLGQGGLEMVTGIAANGNLAEVSATADNLDPNANASTVAFSTPFFETILDAAADSAHRATASRWLQKNAGTSNSDAIGPTSDGVFENIGLFTDTSPSASQMTLLVSHGVPSPTIPKGGALPRVTPASATAYYSSAGLSCQSLSAGPFCSTTQSALYAEADAQNTSGSGEEEMHYLVNTPPGTAASVVNGHIMQFAPGMVDLVFSSSADQQTVTSWVTANVGATGQYHRMVLNGVKVTLIPFKSADTGWTGWRLQFDSVGWPPA